MAQLGGKDDGPDNGPDNANLTRFPSAYVRPHIASDFTWQDLVNNSTLLTLWMDTWFADANDRLGTLALKRPVRTDANAPASGSGRGEIAIEAEGGNGSFLLDVCLRFLRSFAHMACVAHMSFAYRDPQVPVAIHADVVYPATSETWMHDAQEIVHARGNYLSASVQFDVLVDVRERSGSLTTLWVPAVGSLIVGSPWSESEQALWLPQPRSASNAHAHGAISSEAWDRGIAQMRYAAQAQHWVASLNCEIASLFRLDNTPLLIATRDEWKRYVAWQHSQQELPDQQQGDPALFDEEARGVEDSTEGIITLVLPPGDTPHTNEELALRNRARLQQGIATWEQLEGSHFQWPPPKKDLREV